MRPSAEVRQPCLAVRRSATRLHTQLVEVRAAFGSAVARGVQRDRWIRVRPADLQAARPTVLVQLDLALVHQGHLAVGDVGHVGEHDRAQDQRARLAVRGLAPVGGQRLARHHGAIHLQAVDDQSLAPQGHELGADRDAPHLDGFGLFGAGVQHLDFRHAEHAPAHRAHHELLAQAGLEFGLHPPRQLVIAGQPRPHGQAGEHQQRHQGGCGQGPAACECHEGGCSNLDGAGARRRRL
ncbi:hypothetical protein ACFJI0_24375 [Hydrogenophaga sp. UC242_53]|uniref:hypothetical protein n=1 Tax=Hydrogenophaga sp. UC242_53 TaxID=3350170 RepID=UPI0036D2A30B